MDEDENALLAERIQNDAYGRAAPGQARPPVAAMPWQQAGVDEFGVRAAQP